MPKKTESKEPEIGKLSDKKAEEFIPFGIPELDEITGGIPVGRITELWGQEMVGKTYTLGRIMAANTDKKILIIDAEFALNKERLEGFGVDADNIDFIQDARLERVSELVLGAVGKYDLILIDSLAFLTPTTVENASVGENAIGLFSRLVKHWMVKLRPRLGISKTAVVIVNQYRKPLGLYVKAESPGGTSFHHAVDVRLLLTSNSADKIMSSGVQTGHWVHVEVKKSKVSQPFVTTKYKLTY
jgi:recombination protein RecA